MANFSDNYQRLLLVVKTRLKNRQGRGIAVSMSINRAGVPGLSPHWGDNYLID